MPNSTQKSANLTVRPLKDSWRDMMPFMIHSAMFGVIWILNGAYIALWLIAKDISPAMIGTLLLGGALVRVCLTPAVTELCDRLGDRWLVTLGLYCCLLLPTTLLMMMDDVPLWLLYTISVVFIGTIGVTATTLDSYFLLCSRTMNFYLQPVRGVWPLGAAIISPMAGFYFHAHGAEQFAPVVVGVSVICIVSLFILPRMHSERSQLKFSLLKPLQYEGMIFAVIIACLTYISMGGFFMMASVYYIDGMGLTTDDLGWIISAGVVAEGMLLMLIGRFLRQWRIFVIFAVLACIGMVRYLGYLNATEFWVLLAIHAVHGIQFGMTHMTMAEFFRRHIPAQYLSSAQGIYDIFGALGLNGGAAIAGIAYSLYGVQGMIYGAMTMVTITLSLSCYYLIYRAKT